MARQRTNSRKLRLVLVAGLVALTAFTLGNVDLRAIQAGFPAAGLLGAALQAIPCVLVQAGLQVLLARLFDQRTFLQDFQWMLVSFWLLLFLLVGTRLMRSSFTAKSEDSSTPSKDFWKIGIGDVDPVGHRSTRK